MILHAYAFHLRMLYLRAKEWRPCWGILRGHLDEDYWSTALISVSSPQCPEVNTYKPSSCHSPAASVSGPQAILAFQAVFCKPSSGILPGKITCYNQTLSLKEDIFPSLLFLDCVQPGLLKEAAGFMWSIKDSTVQFSSWHQVRQKPIRKILNNPFTWVRM